MYESMLTSDVGGTEFLHIGILDALYTLDVERVVLTRRQVTDSTSMRIGRIVEGVESDGTRFLIATGSDGAGTHEYLRSENGTSWLDSTALSVTPAANRSMQLSDAVWFHGAGGPILIAHGEGDQMIGSANGIAWAVDSAGALDPHWRTGDQGTRFVGIAMAPWGYSAPYFLAAGKLWVLNWDAYNAVEIEDVGNGRWIHNGTVWNGSIFLTDSWNVWEYNPGNAQTVRRVGMFGTDGPPPSWNDDTGHSGIPNNYAVMSFIPGTSDLFAVCRSLAAPRTWRIAVYNGVGWSWLGPEVAASQPYASVFDQYPTNASLTAPSRTLAVATLDDQNSLDFTVHTFPLPTTGDTPFLGSGQRFEDGPLSFETGWFDGGFAELEGVLLKLAFDGYNMSATETVKVEYRLNHRVNASYTTLGTYTRDSQEYWFTKDHRGEEFKSVQFRITLDRGIGTNFVDSTTNLGASIDNDSIATVTTVDSVVFRIGDVIRVDSEQMLILSISPEVLTVTRGHNNTTATTHSNGADIFSEVGVTPEMKALILLFDKKPLMRSAWTIPVDISKTTELHKHINGELASTDRIWQFLKSMVNTPRLLELKIPSIEPGGINVRITDMPTSIDEFREAMGGRGEVNLQFIETVSS